jgi:uncharacterized protein (DUF2461 family)
MDTLPTFSGFPQAGLEFLANLAAHNNREWFEARKNDYRALLAFPGSGVCSDARSVHCRWLRAAFVAIRIQAEGGC